MMKKVINNLRNKPENERRHILHIITFSCAILLILIWVYSVGTTVTKKETKEQIVKDFKPFTVLKDSIFNK